MAFLQIQCHSSTLQMAISLQAIVPQPTNGSEVGIASGTKRAQYPVLYLLHGMSDDETIWCRRTSIERYAAGRDLVIVMPNVHRSYYIDMHHGPRYWTLISEELPELAAHFLPISQRREDTFVAGLSMGGYGAFKLGICRPGQFAAAASLSGALSPGSFKNSSGARSAEWLNTFGSAQLFKESENDLHAQLQKRVNEGTELPRLWQHCGTEDFLYEHNVDSRNEAQRLGVPLAYSEGPGDHSWGLWDEQIQNVLDWLPL